MFSRNHSFFCISGWGFTILLFLMFLTASCVEKKMTVEDAKQISASMQSAAFIPPPRKIDDILSILEQPGQFDPTITAAVTAKADAVLPDTTDPDALMWFYYERSTNARAVGRFSQYLSDSRRALEYMQKVPPEKIKHQKIIAAAVSAEAWAGNFIKAKELSRRLLKMGKFSSNYYIKAWLDFDSGDFEAGEMASKSGISTWMKHRSGVHNMSKVGATWFRIDYDRINAQLFYYKGDYAKSVEYRRETLKKMEREIKAMAPYIYFVNRNMLVRALLHQGKLVEAEVEARATLKEAIGHGGKDAVAVAETIEVLGQILMAQGRLDEADRLIATGGRILKASGLSDGSMIMGRNRMVLGSVAVAQLDFSAARGHFERAKTGLQENRYIYEKNILRNPDVMITHIKTGAAADILPVIDSTWDSSHRNMGADDYRTAKVLGIRAMAYANLKQPAEALADFKAAMPALLDRHSDAGTGFVNKQHQKIIAEAYLDLLRQIHRDKKASDLGVNVAEAAFKQVESMGAGRVQKALGASGARAAASDPELADLVRREQDAQKQILALQMALSGVLALPAAEQNPDTLQSLKASITALGEAQQTLQVEIKGRFPRYADFTDPKPVSMDTIQTSLLPGEAMIILYPTADYTFTWAIPQNGSPAFAIADIGVADQVNTVGALRQALDPDPERFGDIPDLDLEKAYALYEQLLLPVRNGWETATDLVAVVSGPLATIPLGILPTAPAVIDKASRPLFSSYKQIPWLIKKASVARIPSGTALVALRALESDEKARVAFAGFGDPIFNTAQIAQAEAEKTNNDRVASRGRIRVRGIRVTESGGLDKGDIASADIGILSRLPDTREEIESIAAALQADPADSVFTGKLASEKQVKNMPLDKHRVIMFATHALIPGDLDGLYQPAIALSAPDVTGDAGDGLLTMEEVLRLRLNAEWVVLSACNTGAAEGAGAEALSGLGQAFFYAGTRALLVTMWPVETTSAKALTTGLFRLQKEDRALTRARALRKSALDLMGNQVLKDIATQETIASYAHPIFWAPFIVVGDGGQ